MKKIIATANHSKKTFTIRKYWNQKYYCKLRTNRLPKQEFQSCLSNTENDWNNWLKYSLDYFVVKYYN